MPLYLGLDSSTQSLTAIVIEVSDSRREVVFESSMNFDEALPRYGTRHGVLPRAGSGGGGLVAGDVGGGAGDDADAGGAERARPAASHGDRRLGTAARQRLSESRRGARARIAQPREDDRGAGAGDAGAPGVADLDGLEHRRSSAARSRRRSAATRRLPHTPARARSSASPVRRFAGCSSRSVRPICHRACPPGELVPGVAAAGRHAPLDPGDASGHESDGPGQCHVVAAGGRGHGAGSGARAAGDCAVIDASSGRWRRSGRRAVACATRVSSPGRATTRAA